MFFRNFVSSKEMEGSAQAGKELKQTKQNKLFKNLKNITNYD